VTCVTAAGFRLGTLFGTVICHYRGEGGKCLGNEAMGQHELLRWRDFHSTRPLTFRDCQLRSQSDGTVGRVAAPENASPTAGILWQNGDPAASWPPGPKNATRASGGWHSLSAQGAPGPRSPGGQCPHFPPSPRYKPAVQKACRAESQRLGRRRPGGGRGSKYASVG
jgi:hypothetical protein